MRKISRRIKHKAWPIQFINKFIIVLFSGLIWLTLFFACISPNLILGKNTVTGAGTTFWTTGCFLILFVVFILWEVSDEFRHVLHDIFIARVNTSLVFFCLFVLGIQILFVSEVHPPIGWDVGALHQALTDTNDPNIIAYFSLNYNNLPILLVQHMLASFFHTTSWIFFDWVTLCLVDLSALINVISICIIDNDDKKKIRIGIFIHCIFLLLFPTIIVPYTDAWVLPLVSLIFLGICIVLKERYSFIFRAIGSTIIGISATAAFIIKPSAAIPIISFTLILLISVIFPLENSLATRDRPLVRTKKSHKKLKLLILLFITWTCAAGTYINLNKNLTNQTYIHVDKEREIPAIHFISMGASGEGGYNPKDALMVAVLPTKKARINFSWSLLEKRLKKRGIWGNLLFYVSKHRNNTSDGSFAWIKEGNFIVGNGIPQEKGLAGWIEQFVYLYGTRIGDFRFWAQIWWCIWLTMIAFGQSNRGKIVQILRLTIIGGFVYLLIFEGGRSRYLIQFLPAFLILAAILYQNSWHRIYEFWGKLKQKMVNFIKIDV